MPQEPETERADYMIVTKFHMLRYLINHSLENAEAALRDEARKNPGEFVRLRPLQPPIKMSLYEHTFSQRKTMPPIHANAARDVSQKATEERIKELERREKQKEREEKRRKEQAPQKARALVETLWDSIAHSASQGKNCISFSVDPRVECPETLRQIFTEQGYKVDVPQVMDEDYLILVTVEW